MLRRTAYVLTAAVVLAACDSAGTPDPVVPGPTDPSSPTNFTEAHPLTDLVRDGGVVDSYFGFEGGLYFGTNQVPTEHTAFGAETARQIQPLDAGGSPSQDGAIVLMSISMSNATQEWCHRDSHGGPGADACVSHTFMGQAAVEPGLSPELVIVNGARGGRALESWESPDDEEYTRIASEVLPAYGLTEAQVQVVWVKVALKDAPSRPSLPDPNADAYVTEASIGAVVRALKARYPNISQVFFTSRIYAGYASPTQHSPEPWAYETAFAAKWAIEAQITQRSTSIVDTEAGDLSLTPFMAWGPYLWSYGDRPRADGLIWPRDHFKEDGSHPSDIGAEVVGGALLDFFKTSPFTQCWFMDGLTCS